MKNIRQKAEQFLSGLLLVKDPVMRGVAATHIWWDHFSMHPDPTKRRWGFLNYLRQPVVDFKVDELAEALNIAGYGHWNKCIKRAARPKSMAPYGKMNTVKVHVMQKETP